MEATKLKNAPRFGGRKPLFSERDLLVLTGPLLVEQLPVSYTHLTLPTNREV